LEAFFMATLLELISAGQPSASAGFQQSPVASPAFDWRELVRLNNNQTSGFQQSPVGGGSPSGATPPTWQNPFAWQSWDASSGLGDFIGGNAPLFMGGLQTLSGGIQAWNGLQGMSLAKKALAQEKKAFNINLTNQTQSYNTQVGDRIAGRQYNSEAERQAALAAAQLVDRSKYGKGG
jgi:hypothetical protein